MLAADRRLTIGAAFLTGLGLIAAAQLPLLMPTDSRLAVWGAIAAVTACLLAAAGVFAVRTVGSAPGVWRWAVPPVSLLAGAFLFLLLVETAVGRLGLAAGVTLLVTAYFENLRPVVGDVASGGRSGLAHLAGVLDAVALFLFLAFVFGLANFYFVFLPAAALAVGVACAALARENLWRAGLEPGRQFMLVAAAGLVGSETYVAFSFLPTSHLVNAAVAVILLAVAFRIVKLALAGSGEFAFFKKELAAALALAAILLLTAKWL